MEKINEIRKEEFISLYNQGYNDYDIARKMEISIPLYLDGGKV